MLPGLWNWDLVQMQLIVAGIVSRIYLVALLPEFDYNLQLTAALSLSSATANPFLRH